MKEKTILKIIYWGLLIIASFILACLCPGWSFKEFVLPVIVLVCCLGAGYINRMIDEQDED